MNKHRYLISLILILLASSSLSACGAGELFGPTLTPTSTLTATPTITPTATLTLTPTPTSTATPIPPTSTATTPPIPEVGHWEGEPDVSFDIKADGTIYNFSMKAPFGKENSGETCDITLKPFPIEEGAFALHHWVAANHLQDELKLAAAVGMTTPESTQTASDELIAAITIRGHFTSATNLSGTYHVVQCDDPGQLFLSLAPIPTWSARWKTP